MAPPGRLLSPCDLFHPAPPLRGGRLLQRHCLTTVVDNASRQSRMRWRCIWSTLDSLGGQIQGQRRGRQQGRRWTCCDDSAHVARMFCFWLGPALDHRVTDCCGAGRLVFAHCAQCSATVTRHGWRQAPPCGPACGWWRQHLGLNLAIAGTLDDRDIGSIWYHNVHGVSAPAHAGYARCEVWCVTAGLTCNEQASCLHCTK